MTLYGPESFESGGERRRYWPPGMDYHTWLDLPQDQQRARGMIEYHGPSGQGWDGFATVLRILRQTLRPDGPDWATVLDIGCSTGVFLQHTIDAGIKESYGLDISEWATSHPVEGVPADHLAACEVGLDEYPESFPAVAEMLVAFDLLEHIFDCDLDAVLEEMRAHCGKRTDVAFCVCTSGHPGEEWTADKGEYEGGDHLDDHGRPLRWVREVGARDVPPERLWQAVSGHVNLRSHAWWCDALEAAGFRIRWREMHVFEQLRREEATFCTPLGAGNFYPDSGGALRFPGGITDQVSSWGPRNLILAEVA